MKNACCKLSAAPLSLIPHYSPSSSSSSSSRQAPLLSLISHTHFSMAWRCLVNLLKLYGGDTQLVASALTRPKKKRLGLLQTGALNGKQTGLYWAAGAFHILRQYSSFVKVTQSVVLAPSPWFVHAGVCLQSKGPLINMRCLAPGAITHFLFFFSFIWPLFFLLSASFFISVSSLQKATEAWGTLMSRWITHTHTHSHRATLSIGVCVCVSFDVMPRWQTNQPTEEDVIFFFGSCSAHVVQTLIYIIDFTNTCSSVQICLHNCISQQQAPSPPLLISINGVTSPVKGRMPAEKKKKKKSKSIKFSWRQDLLRGTTLTGASWWVDDLCMHPTTTYTPRKYRPILKAFYL